MFSVCKILHRFLQYCPGPGVVIMGIVLRVAAAVLQCTCSTAGHRTCSLQLLQYLHR